MDLRIFAEATPGTFARKGTMGHVAVIVCVTDPIGLPITGLKKENFEILPLAGIDGEKLDRMERDYGNGYYALLGLPYGNWYVGEYILCVTVNDARTEFSQGRTLVKFHITCMMFAVEPCTVSFADEGSSTKSPLGIPQVE